MNKCKRIITALLCVIVMLALPLTVFAADKYLNSEGTTVNISLNSDGSANVTELWSYYYGGDTITRYRRHYLANDYTISEFSVFLDGDELTLLDEPDDSRPEGYAAVYDDDAGTHVEVYMNALEESHTIAISYTVYDAVILHDDVAEFRWNLTSASEPAAISALGSHIMIPYGTSEDGLYIWAHGPSNGTFNKLAENGMVNEFELSASDIPTDIPVDIRMVMPLELFPDGTRRENGDALEEIIAYEKGLENGGTDDEDSETDAVSTVFVIAAILSVISCFTVAPLGSLVNKRILLKKRMNKLRRKPTSSPEYYRNLPDELKPAVIGKLMSVYDGADKTLIAKSGGAFAATMLDLIERGVISFKNDGEKNVFTVNSEGASLNDSEKALLDTLSAATENGSTDIDSLNQYLRDHPTVAQSKRKTFDEALKAEFESYSFIEHHEAKKMNRRVYWIIAGLLLIGAFIVGLVTDLTGDGFISAIVAVSLTAVTLLCLCITKRMIAGDFDILSQDGENRYALWGAFAHFLDDFTTFEERELPEVKVWRRYLVYAAALGRSKKVGDALRVKYPELYNSMYDNDEFWRYQQDMLNAVESVQTASYSVPHSDYDGGSGGGFSSSDGGSDSGSSGGDFD